MDVDELARRLVEIEIKLAFSEDLIERLDQTVIRQQAQIDALLRETARLRDRLADVAAPASRTLRDELPPHY
ncbi:MAG: SlyX family protein [Burkholderiaceae bacterium]